MKTDTPVRCWWNKVRRKVLGLPDCDLVARERETRLERAATTKAMHHAVEEATQVDLLAGLPDEIIAEIDLLDIRHLTPNGRG